jgi:hypothetical protein
MQFGPFLSLYGYKLGERLENLEKGLNQLREKSPNLNVDAILTPIKETLDTNIGVNLGWEGEFPSWKQESPKSK